MNKILYSSTQIRKEIIRIFSNTKRRRVAIAAYVGNGAEAVLPNPKGMEIYCWPQAGGTSSEAIRRLLQRGVKVFFVDSLHMKVYWSEAGVVITSANLSTNTLGSGNLKEFGILVPSKQIDINKIISSLHSRPVTEKELIKLDKENHKYFTGLSIPKNRIGISSFSEWHDLPHRARWMLERVDGSCKVAQNAKQEAKEMYGVNDPNNYISVENINKYSQGDWILFFYAASNKIEELGWMCVDFIVKTAKTDKGAYFREYPFQAVQVWPLTRYPEPPFKIDSKFRRALVKAVNEFGIEKILELNNAIPPRKLIDLILAKYTVGQ